MPDHPDRATLPKPPWLRVRAPDGAAYKRLREIISTCGLHTVCDSAACPNVGECWSAGVATLMILGGRCSRNCAFCGVASGPRGPADPAEPERVADAVRQMGLRHVVVTSVTRDDLADGGAGIWAETIMAVRRTCPQVTIEVLVPDFLGRRSDCETVIAAGPDVFGHNVETVSRLYDQVRPGADFDRSLAVLGWASGAGLRTKSGLMVGLGEGREEVLDVLARLRSAGVAMVTIGQYLRPSAAHHPVVRYVEPDEFDAYARQAEGMGFSAVAAGPLVRSSYHADRQARRAARES